MPKYIVRSLVYGTESIRLALAVAGYRDGSTKDVTREGLMYAIGTLQTDRHTNLVMGIAAIITGLLIYIGPVAAFYEAVSRDNRWSFYWLGVTNGCGLLVLWIGFRALTDYFAISKHLKIMKDDFNRQVWLDDGAD